MDTPTPAFRQCWENFLTFKMSNNNGNKREWTDDEVANLIQLYEKHKFLWNVLLIPDNHIIEYINKMSKSFQIY